MGVERVVWLHSHIIISHSLYPKFGCSLSDISERDYPNRNYIADSIEALDLDSYETSLQGRDNDCTVDAVLGICNERQGKPCNPRHLLVELRMDYKSTKNLSPSDIRQKDVHSRDLLKACVDRTPIDPSLCLLFDNSIIFQAERWLSRIQSEHSYANTWLVFSPLAFCNYVNVNKDFPYTPKAATIDIVSRFRANLDTPDLDILEKESQNISNYLSESRQRYEKGECIYICQCLDDTLPQLKSWVFEDENDIILHEIIIHDIEQLSKSLHNWIEDS